MCGTHAPDAWSYTGIFERAVRSPGPGSGPRWPPKAALLEWRGLLPQRLLWDAVRAVLALQPPASASTGCGRRHFLAPRGLGNALKRSLRLASPIRPRRGLSGVPPAPRRSARSTASLHGGRRTGQRRPGGRARRFPWRRRLALALKRRAARQRRSRLQVMPAPLRIALEQLPALAARGPLARWCRAVAAGSQRGS